MHIRRTKISFLFILLLFLGFVTNVIADAFNDLIQTAKKTEHITSKFQTKVQKAQNHLNNTTESSNNFDIEDNIVFPPQKLLKRMPNFLAGWMQWRDRKTKIYIAFRIKKRWETNDWIIFEGSLDYHSTQNGKDTKSYGYLYIDPITGSMKMTESATVKQKSFDTEGAFFGVVDPETLTITGTWSKRGYPRNADFELGPIDD